MPVRKHDDKKNAPAEVRDSAAVPQKEKTSTRLTRDDKLSPPPKKRINALAAVGKKKKPK